MGLIEILFRGHVRLGPLQACREANNDEVWDRGKFQVIWSLTQSSVKLKKIPHGAWILHVLWDFLFLKNNYLKCRDTIIPLNLTLILHEGYDG